MLQAKKADGEMTVFLFCNGCPRRALDTSLLARYFEVNGCITTNLPDEADYLIFVSCGLVNMKEAWSLRQINKFKKARGELIVAGCLPESSPQKFRQNYDGKFITTRDLNRIDEFFDFKTKLSDIPDANFPLFLLPKVSLRGIFQLLKYSSLDEKVEVLRRAPKVIRERITHKVTDETFLSWYVGKVGFPFLRIGYGCNNRCSYCTLPRRAGPCRSKPIDVCLKEYRKLIEDGYRTFNIVADDIGGYGQDINSSLPELFNALSSVDKGLGVKWIIYGVNPDKLVQFRDWFLQAAAENRIGTLMSAFQSGSERILKLMNRTTNIEKFSGLMLELREVDPDIKMATQVLVGFPSETMDDLYATIDLIKKRRLEFAHIHHYLNSEGTASSKMDNKIDDKTIKKRTRIAQKLLSEAGIGSDVT